MAATLTNTTSNALPINYQLMRELLLTAKTRAPFLAGTNPGVLQKNAGTASVKWERIENLAIADTALTELTGTLALPTRNAVQPVITPVTADMLKYGNGILLTEELELMSVNARASKFMVTLGENAGASYNSVMASVYASGLTQVRYGGGVGDVTSIISSMSLNDIKYAHNKINRNSGMKFRPDAFGSTNYNTSPIRSAYMGICHVDVSEDIRLRNGFHSVEEYGGYTETYPDEIGEVGGVRWCETELSSLITADAATTSAAGFNGTDNTHNDVYDSYVVAMDAIGSVGLGEAHTKEIYLTGDRIPAIEVIHHAPGTSGVGDMLNEVGSIGWKGWLVGKVLNANWGVRIRTLASDLT